jgi:hypothetical protein
MIRIDRLSISLPQNLRHRASSIVNHIGQSLASGPRPEGANDGALSGIEVRCSMHRHDRDIGRAISDAIRGGLANRRGGRGD